MSKYLTFIKVILGVNETNEKNNSASHFICSSHSCFRLGSWSFFCNFSIIQSIKLIFTKNTKLLPINGNQKSPTRVTEKDLLIVAMFLHLIFVFTFWHTPNNCKVYFIQKIKWIGKRGRINEDFYLYCVSDHSHLFAKQKCIIMHAFT